MVRISIHFNLRMCKEKQPHQRKKIALHRNTCMRICFLLIHRCCGFNFLRIRNCDRFQRTSTHITDISSFLSAFALRAHPDSLTSGRFFNRSNSGLFRLHKNFGAALFTFTRPSLRRHGRCRNFIACFTLRTLNSDK